MVETRTDNIRRNLEMVREKICAAAVKSARHADDIQLVVVTKSQPVEVVLAAAEAGVRYFGENYPEETPSKANALASLSGVEWHMIGHLQSRKAKIIADYFTCLHSLDNLGTAEKLNRLLVARNKSLPVLLEFNLGGEESKHGWRISSDACQWENLLPEIEAICSLSNLEVCGLMTMPPFFDNPEEARPYFTQLREIQSKFVSWLPTVNWSQLSMGTSGDFSIAIEEGATIVRVGTAIVGKREVQK